MAGDSAGGNLAAAVTLMARDRGGPAIGFQSLIYPVTDPNFETRRTASCRRATCSRVSGMVGSGTSTCRPPPTARTPTRRRCRPRSGGLPPALIITAEYDPLRDEGEAYGRQMLAAGGTAKSPATPALIHGFVGMAALVPAGRDAIRHEGDAIRQALGVGVPA